MPKTQWRMGRAPAPGAPGPESPESPRRAAAGHIELTSYVGRPELPKVCQRSCNSGAVSGAHELCLGG